MIEVLPLVPSPLSQWTLFTVMSCSAERPGLVAAALVVAHDQGHLGAAETRKALAGAERHLQIRVVVVDDVLHGLPGPEILLAQAREVAGERKQLADEHLGDGAGGPDSRSPLNRDARQRGDDGDEAENPHTGLLWGAGCGRV